MANLDGALAHLRELSARPPFPAPPSDGLRERVMRRRRRRATVGSLVVVVAMASTAVLVLDRDKEVSTSPVALTTTTQDPTTALSVEPSEGLRPNDEVTVTVPVELDPNNFIVAQCGSEAATSNAELWCSIVATTGTPSPLTFEVERVIQVSAGSGERIDCAERAGRCLIGVRTGGRDFTAPISFDPNLPPLGVPSLDAVPVDNRFVTVTGAGYLPAAEVTLTQCRPTRDQEPAEPIFHDCDYTRATRINADDQGRFQVEIPIYQEIFESYTGWAPCTPCRIQAHGVSFDTLATPVDAAGGFAERPSVVIKPAGPYTPGQLVELHGTGFPPDAPLEQAIGWCRFFTGDPATEARGDTPDNASCAYPGTEPITTSDTGAFIITGFPLPSGPFGAEALTCEEQDARCGVAVHPSEGGLPLFVTEFEIDN